MRRVLPSRGDVLAGVSVALVLVPQSLAYAELAGLPPVHGIYAAAIAPVFGALAGSSPYLQTGPVAMTSLLTFGALVTLAPTGTAEFAAYAALLALVVGATRLLVGVLRAGVVAYLMSAPVVTAFTAAGAALIVASQLPTVLDVETSTSNPLLASVQALASPGKWDWAGVAVGAVTVALVLLGRRLHPRLPTVLVVTVVAVVLSRLGAIEVTRVGQIPAGLPPFDLDLPWSALPTLVVPGVVIALVGFAEAAAISRRYAAQDRHSWDPDREFVGQGLANLGAGLFSGYPAGGSFSRSALNRLSGATSRWSGMVTGLVVLGSLPLVPVLSELPRAVLAGFVIAAVWSLLETRPFVEFWRFSRPQFMVAAGTVVATVATAPRVERGVLAGVALSLVVHLWRELRVRVDSWLEATALHVRPAGVLYFASAPALEREVLDLLARHPQVTDVVLHLDRLGRVDLSGVLTLRALVDDATTAGIRLRFADAPGHATPGLRRLLDSTVPTGEQAVRSTR